MGVEHSERNPKRRGLPEINAGQRRASAGCRRTCGRTIDPTPNEKSGPLSPAIYDSTVSPKQIDLQSPVLRKNKRKSSQLFSSEYLQNLSKDRRVTYEPPEKQIHVLAVEETRKRPRRKLSSVCMAGNAGSAVLFKPSVEISEQQKIYQTIQKLERKNTSRPETSHKPEVKKVTITRAIPRHSFIPTPTPILPSSSNVSRRNSRKEVRGRMSLKPGPDTPVLQFEQQVATRSQAQPQIPRPRHVHHPQSKRERGENRGTAGQDKEELRHRPGVRASSPKSHH